MALPFAGLNLPEQAMRGMVAPQVWVEDKPTEFSCMYLH